MVAQKKCYQENNNHNFILRPSLPPPFPAREKSMSFTVSFCHGAVGENHQQDVKDISSFAPVRRSGPRNFLH